MLTTKSDVGVGVFEDVDVRVIVAVLVGVEVIV